MNKLREVVKVCKGMRCDLDSIYRDILKFEPSLKESYIGTPRITFEMVPENEYMAGRVPYHLSRGKDNLIVVRPNRNEILISPFSIIHFFFNDGYFSEKEIFDHLLTPNVLVTVIHELIHYIQLSNGIFDIIIPDNLINNTGEEFDNWLDEKRDQVGIDIELKCIELCIKFCMDRYKDDELMKLFMEYESVYALCKSGEINEPKDETRYINSIMSDISKYISSKKGE